MHAPWTSSARDERIVFSRFLVCSFFFSLISCFALFASHVARVLSPPHPLFPASTFPPSLSIYSVHRVVSPVSAPASYVVPRLVWRGWIRSVRDRKERNISIGFLLYASFVGRYYLRMNYLGIVELMIMIAYSLSSTSVYDKKAYPYVPAPRSLQCKMATHNPG